MKTRKWLAGNSTNKGSAFSKFCMFAKVKLKNPLCFQQNQLCCTLHVQSESEVKGSIFQDDWIVSSGGNTSSLSMNKED